MYICIEKKEKPIYNMKSIKKISVRKDQKA